jgi:hypothetical protein
VRLGWEVRVELVMVVEVVGLVRLVQVVMLAPAPHGIPHRPLRGDVLLRVRVVWLCPWVWEMLVPRAELVEPGLGRGGSLGVKPAPPAELAIQLLLLLRAKDGSGSGAVAPLHVFMRTACLLVATVVASYPPPLPL